MKRRKVNLIISTEILSSIIFFNLVSAQTTLYRCTLDWNFAGERFFGINLLLFTVVLVLIIFLLIDKINFLGGGR
ncbi:MAG: hypothetical protein QW273_00695 [Candidatus Pacearchaeota archaeon]